MEKKRHNKHVKMTWCAKASPSYSFQSFTMDQVRFLSSFQYTFFLFNLPSHFNDFLLIYFQLVETQTVIAFFTIE